MNHDMTVHTPCEFSHGVTNSSHWSHELFQPTALSVSRLSPFCVTEIYTLHVHTTYTHKQLEHIRNLSHWTIYFTQNRNQ